jgi:hypothetical protein
MTFMPWRKLDTPSRALRDGSPKSFRAAWQWFCARVGRYVDHQRLHQLDDRSIKDLGIDRVREELNVSAWRSASGDLQKS